MMVYPQKCALAQIPLATALFVFALLGASPAYAKDPCKTTLCMYGKFTGNSGGSECRSAVADYFDILVFKKKKRIDWNQTAKERLGFMNSCPGADRGKTQEINNKFGKSRG
ncbi:killer protein [Pseudomonas protegens]|uniref:Killer protein n=2 Tax=Pseudomonas protegens TaxID=380021 RepID=A0A2T6GBK5_9PSED|nr:TrbM/KikA/MpfK family conjugal transfer protein [Pseudomonas protegens]PUA41535.1 killer protein [Pseudomonas protegens]